jgi:hypothetical protein
MGIGDILDETFRLYRQRFFTFLLIALVVYVPYGLLMAAFQTVVAAQVAEPVIRVETPLHQLRVAPRPVFNPVALVAMGIGVLVVAIVLMPLCSAALVQNISGTYLGEKLTAGQSYARAAPRLIGLLCTNFLAAIVIGLGFFMLIVPMFIFILWFLVLVPVVVLEGKAGPAALGRSRELMRGNIGKGFLIALLVAIIGGTIGGIMGGFIGALTSIIPLPYPAIRSVIETAVQAVVLPIQTAPWTLLYYDLRIRKEAFDLQKLAETMGPVAAT